MTVHTLSILAFLCPQGIIWERDLNENTNGLIRQYFPKKTNFLNVEPDEIFSVAIKLNSRPRKTLEFCTPNDLFYRIWLQ